MFSRRKIFLALTLLWMASAWNSPLNGQMPSPSPAASPPGVTDLKTLSGHVYKNARVFRVEPDGINYMFSGGMVKIPFGDLPEEIRKQYGYNAQAAEAFAVADEQAQERTYRTSQEQLASQARKKQTESEAAARHATNDSYLSRDDAPKKHEPKALVDPSWQGGLKTLARLSVAEVIASPFTLKNALIEMAGIDRIELKETSAGVYKVTVWTPDYDCLTATLPAAQARLAQTSKTLFIAVKDPSSNPVKVTIFGNASTYEGLSTMPTVVWH